MIKEFIKKFEENKGELRAIFYKENPEEYQDIIKAIVDILSKDEVSCDRIDPERIHNIDDGDYQGTLIFIIGSMGYQPNIYWYVKVDYGSCSGCDTLENIKGYSDEPPSDQQLDDYMTLALHIVQGLKLME